MAGYRKVLLFPDSSTEVGAYTLSSGFVCLQCERDWFAYVAAGVIDSEFEAKKARYATGATQVSLTDKGARSIPWLIPTADLVTQFSAVAEPMLALLLKLRLEESALTDLRDLLLPQLVTGAIDISRLDLDALADETAM